MNTTDGLTARTISDLDPDNWLQIPEFGINPQDVDFKGFALPITTSSCQADDVLCLIRELVKTARFLIRQEGFSLSEVKADFIQFKDMIDAKGESEKLNPSRRQFMAFLYMLVMQDAQIAVGRSVKGAIARAVCFKEIANCAREIRTLMLLSLNGKDEFFKSIVTEVCQRFKAQKQARSDAGKQGAGSKHAPANAVKKWALGEAAAMRGAGMRISGTDMARKLSNNLPAHLANAVKDPMRLIVKALQAPQSSD